MLGALDMFSIGIGPSSSHTIGPMKAALQFVQALEHKGLLFKTCRIKIVLYGSLALTGMGHGTIFAVLQGLIGEDPKTIDPDKFTAILELVKTTKEILVYSKHMINFNYDKDFILNKQFFLPEHPNGMEFTAEDDDCKVILSKKYFSIGGGFILDEKQIHNIDKFTKVKATDIPYPFSTACELFNLCKLHDLTIAQLVTQNELVRHTELEVYNLALEIVEVMHNSVQRGLVKEGNLPGGLNVRRRAPELYKKLNKPLNQVARQDQRLLAITYAIAVNEENAAFSKVVTAPTNGSSGTIPGVLEYYRNFYSEASQDKLVEFILTAGAIGMLYKFGASISAAEVGCQGEIGVACSMASGALTAVLGGNLIQIEKAAEIAMEHSLGMTCDPIEGLVQIPCIERNGVAASRAIDIANIALIEEEPGLVSLDDVIKTMLQTGKDMSMKYKETALGGLAVNVVNC